MLLGGNWQQILVTTIFIMIQKPECPFRSEEFQNGLREKNSPERSKLIVPHRLIQDTEPYKTIQDLTMLFNIKQNLVSVSFFWILSLLRC